MYMGEEGRSIEYNFWKVWSVTWYNTLMMNRCHYIFVQTHRMDTPRVNLNANCRFWAMMMYQYRFMHYSRCTTLVGDVDNGESYSCVGPGNRWEIADPSSQFCCTPKTDLKTLSFKGHFSFMQGVLGYHSPRNSSAPALWEGGTDCLLSGLIFQRCLYRKQLWKVEPMSPTLTRASLLTSQCKKT